MAGKEDFRILVNLGWSFYRSPFLQDTFARLATLGEVQQVFDAAEFDPAFAHANAWLGWGSPVPTPAMLANSNGLRWSGHLNLTRDGALALINHGVTVSEARHCWSPAVAEMALGLILADLRRTSEYHCAMRSGGEVWPFSDFPAQLDPRERKLTGRPVGIVGFGGIGRRLAELLAPFHVPLYIHDPFIPPEAAAAHGATPMALIDLLKSSDVVVLCAANTREARHLIGREEINALRPDAVLVNVGRASLVDTAALLDRLKKNDLTAMLDVFDQEPLPLDSELRQLPNAFLTPHRAGGIVESVQRGLNLLVDDLYAYKNGRSLACRLDETAARTALA